MVHRCSRTGRLRLRLAAAAAVVAACAGFAATAGATSHDYCAWDGSYLALPSYTTCFQSGDNYLVDNHAWLPYLPTTPTIYCGAHLNGSDYGGYASGNPSCDHTYGGGNLLKADEWVDVAATTHGVIYY